MASSLHVATIEIILCGLSTRPAGPPLRLRAPSRPGKRPFHALGGAEKPCHTRGERCRRPAFSRQAGTWRQASSRRRSRPSRNIPIPATAAGIRRFGRSRNLTNGPRDPTSFWTGIPAFFPAGSGHPARSPALQGSGRRRPGPGPAVAGNGGKPREPRGCPADGGTPPGRPPQPPALPALAARAMPARN